MCDRIDDDARGGGGSSRAGASKARARASTEATFRALSAFSVAAGDGGARSSRSESAQIRSRTDEPSGVAVSRCSRWSSSSMSSTAGSSRSMPRFLASAIISGVGRRKSIAGGPDVRAVLSLALASSRPLRSSAASFVRPSVSYCSNNFSAAASSASGPGVACVHETPFNFAST